MSIQSFGNSHQDIFVLSMLNYKTNGYFLEIGSHDPMINNNTYLLENRFNWKGLMIDYLPTFEERYKELRPNSIYEIKDARIVDYKKIFEENNFPLNMDYLQIDLDADNGSTIETLFVLKENILNKYKFATITFEHDIYRGNFYNTREISRKIFLDKGYILLFPDVKIFGEGFDNPYEDWYVHPDLISTEIINKFKTDKSLLDTDIINIITK